MKIAKAMLTLLLVICIITPSLQTANALDIMPINEDISKANASIAIDAGGRACCTTNAQSGSQEHNLQATMTLYRISGNMSIPIKSWTLYGTYSLSGSKTYYVTPGYQYQVISDVTVTDSNGKFIETVQTYSRITTY